MAEQSDAQISRAIATLRSIVSPKRKRPAKINTGAEEDKFLKDARSAHKRGDKLMDEESDDNEEPGESSISQYTSGDLFGTRGDYEDSLIYRSRLGSPKINTFVKPQDFERSAIFAQQMNLRTSNVDEAAKRREKSFTSVLRAKEIGGKPQGDMSSKRDCVNAINKWAANESLHANLLDFGIVEAIHKIVTGNVDESVLSECVETLFLLSCNPAIHNMLIRADLHKNVLEMIGLAEQMQSVSNVVNCCSILLNLSSGEKVNDKYIQIGVVPEINRLQGLHPQVQTIFLKLIFNMVNKLERNTHWTQDMLYFIFVVLKMANISPQNIALIVKIVSRASTLNEVPQHLCEKDITSILRNQVSRVSKWRPDFAHPVLKYVCTTAYFVSQSVEAATKMVDSNALKFIRELLDAVVGDEDLVCICIATVGNMARSRLVRTKLVKDGAVHLLAGLAEKCAQQLQWLASGVIEHASFEFEGMLNMCVAALAMLSQDDESAVMVAIEGGMKLLVIVATYAKDTNLRSEAIIALCNLLCSSEIKKLFEEVGETVHAALNVLVLYHKQILVHDLTTAGYFATVFNNMTLTGIGRNHLKNVPLADVIVWIALMAEGDDAAIELCLCCMYNCSEDDDLLKTFQTKKHIGSIIEVMKISKGTRVDELCIATLHRLAQGFASAGLIFAGEGAMDEIIDLTTSVAPRTRELAVTTLAQMTLDDNNIDILVKNGAIVALAEVAKTSEVLAQRATAALSNICGHNHGMYVKELLKAGAVNTMIKLSGSKDPEVRRLSAHAICHLVSCAEGPREQMIKEGAVNALVLTGLIRSSEEDIVTRQACCCAMYTLCSTGNVEILGDWRVVWSATCMLSLDGDFCLMAATIMANLSVYPSGRHNISNKQTIEELISVSMSRGKVKVSVEVQKIIALILHNVICGFGRIKEPTIQKLKTGKVESFEDVGSDDEFSDDEEDIENDPQKGECFDGTDLSTLYSGEEGAQHRQACRIIANCGGTKALSSLARAPYPESREHCIAALSVLCTLDDTHERFLNDGGFVILNEVSHLDRNDLGTKACWTIRNYCLVCAVDAALRSGSRYKAVKDGALEMIVPIVQTSKDEETDERCCRCIELFAMDISARAFMIDSGVVQAMDELTIEEELPEATLHSRAMKFARTLLYICSTELKERNKLVDHGVVQLMARYAKIPIESIAQEVAESLSLLCECENRIETIIYDGGLQIVQDVLAHGLQGEFGKYSHDICDRCSFIVGNFSSQRDALYFMIENGLIETTKFLSKSGSHEGIHACVKVVACACLVEESKDLLIELRKHKEILVMYSRLLETPAIEHFELEISLLALSLLNMTKTSDAEVQTEIMNCCDGALLIENARKVTDAEREEIWSLLPHLPPSDDTGGKRSSTTEMTVPQHFSMARKVEWPVYNFFTTPKQPDSAELKEKPKIAPRWKPNVPRKESDIDSSTHQLNNLDDEDAPSLLGMIPSVITLANATTNEFSRNITNFEVTYENGYVGNNELVALRKKHAHIKRTVLLPANQLPQAPAKPIMQIEEDREEPQVNVPLLQMNGMVFKDEGITGREASASFVDSLMEVVVDRIVEEPERLDTMDQSKQSAIAHLEANDSVVNLDAGGNIYEIQPLNAVVAMKHHPSASPSFSVPGIPRKWASPKSPMELRGLAHSLGAERLIDSKQRQKKATDFVQMMRKKSAQNLASDKRQLAVNLATTLHSLQTEAKVEGRRSRTSPSTRRSGSGMSPSTNASMALPDINQHSRSPGMSGIRMSTGRGNTLNSGKKKKK